MQQDDTSTNHPDTSMNRVGMVLFLTYVILYGVFVTLNTFFPASMGTPSLFGLNLSVSYGFTLIFGAVGLAFLYTLILRNNGSKGSQS